MTRALWLADVLSDAFRGRRGFQVDVIPGWEGRGRDGIDLRGVIDHHTGAGSYHALLHYMAHGSSIAPLCNTATCRPQDGVVRITVVAAGKANHAGRGRLAWTGRVPLRAARTGAYWLRREQGHHGSGPLRRVVSTSVSARGSGGGEGTG